MTRSGLMHITDWYPTLLHLAQDQDEQTEQEEESWYSSFFWPRSRGNDDEEEEEGEGEDRDFLAGLDGFNTWEMIRYVLL